MAAGADALAPWRAATPDSTPDPLTTATPLLQPTLTVANLACTQRPRRPGEFLRLTATPDVVSPPLHPTLEPKLLRLGLKPRRCAWPRVRQPLMAADGDALAPRPAVTPDPTPDSLTAATPRLRPTLTQSTTPASQFLRATNPALVHTSLTAADPDATLVPGSVERSRTSSMLFVVATTARPKPLARSPTPPGGPRRHSVRAKPT